LQNLANKKEFSLIHIGAYTQTLYTNDKAEMKSVIGSFASLSFALGIFASLNVVFAVEDKQVLHDVEAQKQPALRRVAAAQKNRSPTDVRVPMFYGLGQGTTGTRSLFHAMCRLNVPSAHYGQMCFDVDEANELTREEVVAIQAHNEVVQKSHEFARCAGRGGNHCQLDEALVVLHEIKSAVERVILSGAVNFISDTPYQHLFHFVMETLRSARPEFDPVFLMTERNPNDWATRRHHKHAETVVCRYYYDMSVEQVEKFDLENPDHDPLDWSQCMKYTFRNVTETSKASTYDVYVSLGQLIKEANGNENKMQRTVARTRRAYDRYQRKCLGMDNILFTINFFNQDGEVSEESLAVEIYNRMFDGETLPFNARIALQQAGVSILDPQVKGLSGTLSFRKMGSPFNTEVLNMKI